MCCPQTGQPAHSEAKNSHDGIAHTWLAYQYPVMSPAAIEPVLFLAVVGDPAAVVVVQVAVDSVGNGRLCNQQELESEH